MTNGSRWGDLVAPLPVPQPATPLSVVAARREGMVYERVYEWRSYPSEAPLLTRRDDPSDPESPEIEEPTRWWTPRSIGFRAKILVNPLGGEVRRAVRAHIAWLTSTGDEADHLKAIADRVIAWDYVIVDEDGARHQVPPPAADKADGWQQFYELPNDVLIWLKEEVENAHLPKAPTRKSGKPAGPTALQEQEPESPSPDEAPPES